MGTVRIGGKPYVAKSALRDDPYKMQGDKT
jgi:hypothetical protein